MLVRAAVADDRLLDLHRRIFKQFIRIGLAGDQSHAARAADLYACRHVFGEKQFLKRNFVRLEGLQEPLHAGVNAPQTRGKGVARIGNQRAVLHQLFPVAVRLDHAPAHCRQTGVNAQYSQKSLRLLLHLFTAQILRKQFNVFCAVCQSKPYVLQKLHIHPAMHKKDVQTVFLSI